MDARAPNYELAEVDYMSGMKYKDIADKYSVSMNTVKSWKKRYAWDRKKCAHKNEKVCTQNKPNNSVKKEPVAREVESVLDNTELTNKQRLFCLYFIKSFNATKSYQKAYEVGYDVANAEGYKLLVNPCIKTEIERLKKERLTREFLSESDIFQKYMDIAFADIGDYLTFGKKQVPQWNEVDGTYVQVIDPNTGKQKISEYSYVDLKESCDVDTSIISEVSEGKDGVKVKLADRMKALDWLTAHMDMATAEQKAKVELLKAQREKTNIDIQRASGHTQDGELSQLDIMLGEIRKQASLTEKVDDSNDS